MNRHGRLLSGSGAFFGLVLCLAGVLVGVSPAGATPAPTATFVVPSDATAGASTVTLRNAGVALSPMFTFTTFVFAATLSDPEVGANYNAHLQVSGGRAPYSWTVASGAVPPGTTFSVSGVLSGTPRSAGTSLFTVQATDANGVSAQDAVSVTVDPGPSVVTSSLPPATVGSAYSVVFTEVGGTAPFVWSINSGPIPGGLVLSSTGVLSGRPGALGSTSVSIRVSDALGSVASRTFTVTVRPPPEAMTILTSAGATESASSFSAPFVSVAPISGGVTVGSSLDGTKLWIATASGVVVGLNGTASLGQLHRPPRRPVVAIAVRSDGTGYWLVTAAGHVYGFGSARNYGSVRGRVDGRVVGIAATPGAKGYVIVTNRGHLYSFGKAPRVDSPQPGRLHGAVIGAIVSSDGKGVFVASTRGVVLGLGSARAERIRTPRVTGAVSAIVPVPRGNGYWLVTSLGTIAPAGAAAALPVLAIPPGFVVAAASGV